MGKQSPVSLEAFDPKETALNRADAKRAAKQKYAAKKKMAK